MAFLITSTEFQALALGWISAITVVLGAVLVMVLHYLPQIEALWTLVHAHDRQILNLTPTPPHQLSQPPTPDPRFGVPQQ
jgi:hypothetical protein